MYEIGLKCSIVQEAGGFSIELIIGTLPTQGKAEEIADWLRDCIRENASKIGIVRSPH